MIAAAALFLGFLPFYASSQAATEATCAAGFQWAFNSLGQSPCVIASALAETCTGGATFTIPALTSTQSYTGPDAGASANTCRCSSVYYSLLSACAVCQNALVLGWSTYNANCTQVLLTVFQNPIPNGVNVPHYAYLDPTPNNGFNAANAETATGAESTSAPQPTSSAGSTSSSTTSSSPTGSTSKGKKSNTGAIAGGVVAGVVVLAIIAALALFFLRRRRRQQPSTPYTNNTTLSEKPSDFNSHPTAHGAYPASPMPALYHPDDPSTFPTNSPSYGGMPHQPHQQPYSTNLTPDFTGATQPTMVSGRPTYHGVAEVM